MDDQYMIFVALCFLAGIGAGFLFFIVVLGLGASKRMAQFFAIVISMALLAFFLFPGNIAPTLGSGLPGVVGTMRAFAPMCVAWLTSGLGAHLSRKLLP
ncbi:hypothetical protein ACVWWJ_002697 [Luteibacter sp. HA06]